MTPYVLLVITMLGGEAGINISPTITADARTCAQLLEQIRRAQPANVLAQCIPPDMSLTIIETPDAEPSKDKAAGKPVS